MRARAMDRDRGLAPSSLCNCPYCTSTILPMWSSVGFWRCASCGLILRNPVPTSRQLDELYESGWQTPLARTRETGGTTPGLARVYAQRLASSLGIGDFKGLRVLDFGAGRGDMLDAVRALGGEAHGVEPYGYSHLLARGHRVYRSMDEIPGNLRFDGIVTIDVVEHLAEPWNEIGRLWDLLASSGWVFIATPNPSGLGAKVLGARWKEARKPGHLN